MNGDVHGGHASCGSATRASRFLISLVTCFAHTPASRSRPAAWRGPCGDTDPLGEGVLPAPTDEQPTARQTSVTQ